MLEKLKAEFDGILELVQKVPDPLKETALKTILDHWFATNSVPPQGGPNTQQGQGGSPQQGTQVGTGGGVPDAVKPFITANGLTPQVLEKAFHPLGAGAQLLLSDIEGSGKALQQVNLAILLCVRQALETGTFTCTLKELREMCVHHNCYDSPNFSKNLKTHKNYFKPRAKGADLELSGPGLKKAAELIKSAAAS